MNEIMMKGIYDMVISLVALGFAVYAGYLLGCMKSEKKSKWTVHKTKHNTKAQFIDIHDINY